MTKQVCTKVLYNNGEWITHTHTHADTKINKSITVVAKAVKSRFEARFWKR